VGRGAGLEFFASGERTGDHRIEARITHQSCCGFEGILIIAGERDTEPISFAVRLGLERFEVHRVECLHPSSRRKYRCSPTGRALRMLGRLACDLSVTLRISISSVENDFTLQG